MVKITLNEKVKKIISISINLLRVFKFKFLYKGKIEIPYRTKIRKGLKIELAPNGKLTIGKGVTFNYDCSISCLERVEIKNNTIFGENVKLYDHNHRFNDPTKPISKQGYSTGEIKIGSNCWIGSNVVILKNVTIGNNVVIGANSTIKESVPDNTIVRTRDDLVYDTIIMKSPVKLDETPLAAN